MSTRVETAFVPNYKQPPEVLPIYGCSSKCELWPDVCWRDMFAKRMKCPKCRAGIPHVHWDRMWKIPQIRKPAVFSGHFCEIADLSQKDIKNLQLIMAGSPRHLFHIFSHQADFFYKYSKWTQNVWCCQSITKGEICFSAELECGKRVAYCKPVMGKLWIDTFKDPHLLVIGLLNHADYAKLGITLEKVAVWIKSLMADGRALGIPIFMKSHNLWAKLGIEVVQEWPK